MSNKILNLFLSGGVVLGIAYAAPSAPWRSSVGVEGQYYNYREPHLMHLVGWLAGVNAETSYHLPSQWFLGLNGRFLGGKANYGSYDTGRVSNEPQMLFEARFLFGKEISLATGASLSPYTGVGYRYKADGKNGKTSTTGHLTYKRRSTYYYLPLGLQYRKNLNADWGMVMQAEYDQLLRGRQESELPGWGTDKHTQNSGFGVKLKVDAVKKLPNNRALSFGPYIHYWDIKDSDKNTYAQAGGKIVTTWEPHNKTWETGLAVKYHF